VKTHSDDPLPAIRYPLYFVWRQSFDAERMDFATHLGAKGCVHQLVTRDCAFADELRRYDACREMGVVVGLDDHFRARQASGD